MVGLTSDKHTVFRRPFVHDRTMYAPTHPRVAEAAVVFLRPVLRGAVDVAACIRDSSARGGCHRLGAYAVVDGPTSLVERVPKHRPMLRRAIVARYTRQGRRAQLLL